MIFSVRTFFLNISVLFFSRTFGNTHRAIYRRQPRVLSDWQKFDSNNWTETEDEAWWPEMIASHSWMQLTMTKTLSWQPTRSDWWFQVPTVVDRRIRIAVATDVRCHLTRRTLPSSLRTRGEFLLFRFSPRTDDAKRTTWWHRRGLRTTLKRILNYFLFKSPSKTHANWPRVVRLSFSRWLSINECFENTNASIYRCWDQTACLFSVPKYKRRFKNVLSVLNRCTTNGSINALYSPCCYVKRRSVC